MDKSTPGVHQLSRRAILRTGASAVLGAAATAVLPGPAQGAMRRSPAAGAAAVTGAQDADTLFRVLDSRGEPVILRADFVPGPDGRIAWFRFGGRLHARQG